jgi:N-acetylmuramoyl-L-alanine amidase CwlA
VCGSRTWTDGKAIYEALAQFGRAAKFEGELTVIHGAARGADMLADGAARELKEWSDAHLINWCISILAFPADWKKHGKAAGYIRNKQMLEEGKPDLVLAFWDRKSKGTASMIKLAIDAGVSVKIVPMAED